MLSRVTENTLVPISLVIILFGGVAWLTAMANEVRANTGSLAKMEERNNYYVESIEKFNDKLQEIRERLIKIETEIKRR